MTKVVRKTEKKKERIIGLKRVMPKHKRNRREGVFVILHCRYDTRTNCNMQKFAACTQTRNYIARMRYHPMRTEFLLLFTLFDLSYNLTIFLNTFVEWIKSQITTGLYLQYISLPLLRPCLDPNKQRIGFVEPPSCHRRLKSVKFLSGGAINSIYD